LRTFVRSPFEVRLQGFVLRTVREIRAGESPPPDRKRKHRLPRWPHTPPTNHWIQRSFWEPLIQKSSLVDSDLPTSLIFTRRIMRFFPLTPRHDGTIPDRAAPFFFFFNRRCTCRRTQCCTALPRKPFARLLVAKTHVQYMARTRQRVPRHNAQRLWGL